VGGTSTLHSTLCLEQNPEFIHALLLRGVLLSLSQTGDGSAREGCEFWDEVQDSQVSGTTLLRNAPARLTVSGRQSGEERDDGGRTAYE